MKPGQQKPLSCGMKSIAAGKCFALLMLLAVAGAPVAKAQGARVEGVVRDATGAVVPGAQVELRTKSYSIQETTDASGAYAFENVQGTTGTISVNADGFQKTEQTWTASGTTPVRVDVVIRPSSVSEKIIVTAARAPTRLNETPLSDIQLTRDDLKATPALTLDDSLRQVPGFSLFRRSSSRIANPTTMGVSLRGLGSGSGTSRAVVLEDGIPLTDPFGSWVYWDRIPVRIGVEYRSRAGGRIESLWELRSRWRRTVPDASRSSRWNLARDFLRKPKHAGPLAVGGRAGPANGSPLLAAKLFHTDGYVLVPEASRGSVDTRAGSQHGTARSDGRTQDRATERDFRAWLVFRRHAQKWNVRSRTTASGSSRVRWVRICNSAKLARCTLRSYGEAETYHQTFSSVGTGRNSEILTDQQAVPAQGVGGSAVWTRNLGRRQTLVAGFDEHEEIGHSNEILFSALPEITRRTHFQADTSGRSAYSART